MNPVVASLIYNMANGIASRGGHPECTVGRATSLARFATDQLGVIVRQIPKQIFPATEGDLVRSNAVAPVLRPFQWAVAMLTAPRGEPKIEQTLDSVFRAGFEHVHLFAEPGAWIPECDHALTITQRAHRFGTFLNFYSALTSLLHDQPDADAYVIFQDDIVLAEGLREWCENQLWPHDNGVVSLFTPRLHSSSGVGWQVVSPGYQRVCGAQALVFRRDILHRFLSDPHVIPKLNHRQEYDDATLGGWLSREGCGLAYHTPSPVQHVGKVSSLFTEGHDQRNLANAVGTVDEIAHWKPSSKPGKIGLVGWNSMTGLGSLNRDLVTQLSIKHWLSPPHPWLGSGKNNGLGAVEIVSETSPAAIREWLRGLDWLLFAERPYIDHLPRTAAHLGLGIACIPMWEWVRPDLPWLQFVDLMVCPNRHAYLQMEDWTRRYGYGWKTIYVPWPVDSARFPWKQRNICREFLFVNGWGGGFAKRLDGSQTPYERKGLELILSAARLAPDLKFVIRSLHALPLDLPANVRVASSVADNADAYDEGDVCVQPSHYEGLGLQLLECQAAGMPLVTTDASPMNEVNPWRTFPTSGQEVVDLFGTHISSELMTPEAIVDTLRPLVGLDIRRASLDARQLTTTHRHWDTARRLILPELMRR